MHFPRHLLVRDGLRAIAKIALIGVISMLGMRGVLTAQSVSIAGGVAGLPAAAPAIPDLNSIHAAATGQDVTATRIRRFLSDNGNVVSVRELYEGKRGAPGSQTFSRSLTFLAVEGEPSGSALSVKWAETYQRFGLLMANSGVFTVRDPIRAQQNYTLHDFGPVVRASRAARRFVVFPNTFDRAFWVIDVDEQTSALLYSAEFDGQLRLASEVEVIAFLPTARSLTQQPVVVYPDFDSAAKQMTSTVGLVDPDVSAASAFSLESVEVRDDVLSGQQMMVSSYSDGVDQLLVVQMPNTADWLAGLPGTHKGGQAIGRRYRDPTMSVHMFWEGGVTFHVAGGGALTSLDALAKHLYLQAINTP